jgi:hypothetical protein
VRKPPIQFHLLTLLLTSITLSALLYLNLYCYEEVESADHHRTILCQVWGWPCKAIYRRMVIEPGHAARQIGYFHGAGDGTYCFVSIFEESADESIINVFTAVFFVTLVANSSERFLRRSTSP